MVAFHCGCRKEGAHCIDNNAGDAECRFSMDGIEEGRREGCCRVEVGTDLAESRTQIILLLDTKSVALRNASVALEEQAPLFESKTFLKSANFNLDNLGP